MLAKFRAGNFPSRANSLARRRSPWNASFVVRCRGDRSRCVAILPILLNAVLTLTTFSSPGLSLTMDKMSWTLVELMSKELINLGPFVSSLPPLPLHPLPPPLLPLLSPTAWPPRPPPRAWKRVITASLPRASEPFTTPEPGARLTQRRDEE